ncbi:uncharacterized protein WCC33_013338 [Rhinophrynus dorsalis]
MEATKATLTLLLSWILVAGSQNLIKNAKDQKLEGQLLISELNSDNPGHDTTEFLELYHTSGQNVSLDGYTLVFYNGKTNTAYKVLNLAGNSTDKRGFFLIGSLGLNPKPAIILPHNTIQNGPDAIALYFGKGPYRENMRVTSEGLVDVLVHKAKGTDEADVLQSVLTPGIEAFLEDSSFHSSDESIGRCMEMGGQWTFQMTHLSPGGPNNCKRISEIVISEVPSPFAQDLYIEIQGPPSTFLSDLVLAFISGEKQEIYYVTDIRGETDQKGFYLLESEKYSNRAQQTLPDIVRLLTKGVGAVALYFGKSSRALLNAPFPTNGLVDAFVYGEYEVPVSQPLQNLSMGHAIIYWHSGDVNISASRCSGPAGDPTAFLLKGSTPGQANNCTPESRPADVNLCFRIADCSLWQGEQILSDLLSASAQLLKPICQCDLPISSFTDARLSCTSNLLTLYATSTIPNINLTNVQKEFVTSGSTLVVGGMNATVVPTCSQPAANPTLSPDNSTDAPPASEAPGLLISEVNPNNPGSAEDTEYVELYEPKNISVSLDGYWLLFYNGKNNLAYLALDLKGHRTDTRGYFLVGSSKLNPKPHITLPFNTIQNGADAVALYYRPGKGYRKNMELTADGLVDTIVYVSRVGDDSDGLLRVLAPGQDPVHEDERFFLEDESLSRCHGLMPLDLSSYQVTKITPLADNDCTKKIPSPIPSVTPHQPLTSSRPVPSATPVSLVINEVGVSREPEPYSFIELKGPPGGKVQGLTLVLYGMDGKVYDRFMLQGTLRESGIYLISANETSSDQHLPPLYRPYPFGPQALVLYQGSPESFPIGSGVTKKKLLDAIVYMWKTGAGSEALRDLSRDSIILYGEQRSVSLSRCPRSNDISSSLLLPVLLPSPGTENLCPSSVTSLQLDLCMKDSSLNCSEWETMQQKTLDSLKMTLSLSIEHHCSCSVPPSYIQDLKLTCIQSRLSISGSVLTFHSEQHLIQSWNKDLLTRPQPFTQQGSSLESLSGCLVTERSRGSLKTWQISLLVLLCLLFISGAICLILYLRKRSPQNYTSIEMNRHRDHISDY